MTKGKESRMPMAWVAFADRMLEDAGAAMVRRMGNVPARRLDYMDLLDGQSNARFRVAVVAGVLKEQCIWNLDFGAAAVFRGIQRGGA